jgi:hypothetical protein
MGCPAKESSAPLDGPPTLDKGFRGDRIARHEEDGLASLAGAVIGGA